MVTCSHPTVLLSTKTFFSHKYIITSNNQLFFIFLPFLCPASGNLLSISVSTIVSSHVFIDIHGSKGVVLFIHTATCGHKRNS